MALEFPHLLKLFPPNGFRFTMNLRTLQPEAFFSPKDPMRELLAQRRKILAEEPEHYVCQTPRAEIGLLARFLRRWTQAEDLTGIAADLEPDLVLMQLDAAGNWTVAAGAVCFPSTWSLPEKLGHPMDFVHGAVPDLNVQIGPKITHFFNRLAQNPGAAYGRENWGLSASPQLDQHIRHKLPPVPINPDLSQVWLRVEDQALVALDTRTFLFGIRIEIYPLTLLSQDRLLSARLAHELKTMPSDMLQYKRLGRCRDSLVTALTDSTRSTLLQ
ncbi:MAG TPA: heme-dependent oxidative N-demethylase subunit alpha family protein [Chthoniobacterales bacterium]